MLDLGTAHGLSQLLVQYRQRIPHVKLAGPTSFGPLIRRAVDIVVSDNNSFHILVVIADGAITRPSSIDEGQRSQFEQDTIDAIVEASHHPLSIVVIGVGDGPVSNFDTCMDPDIHGSTLTLTFFTFHSVHSLQWQQMEEFDDRLPDRKFDNFQFVSFDAIQQSVRLSNPHVLEQELEARFALHALMEIPEQFNAILSLQLLGAANHPNRAPQNIVFPQPIPTPAASSPNRAVPVLATLNVGQSDVPFAPSVSDGFVCELPMAAATTNIPPLFLCALSQTMMKDPVLSLDGQTYERHNIVQFFATHGAISPVTHQPLASIQVFENAGIKNAIEQWKRG